MAKALVGHPTPLRTLDNYQPRGEYNMSHKDYIAIAKILSQYTDSDLPIAGYIATELANYFKASNPRFDTLKFAQACYPWKRD